MDEVYNFFCGLRIVVAVTLQNAFLCRRILNRNERNVGLLFGADKEYKRILLTQIFDRNPYVLRNGEAVRLRECDPTAFVR